MNTGIFYVFVVHNKKFNFIEHRNIKTFNTEIKIHVSMPSHFCVRLKIIFPAKKRISTALMMENPVRSPMVPPIADNMSTNFAALSFVILSNVGVSK